MSAVGYRIFWTHSRTERQTVSATCSPLSWQTYLTQFAAGRTNGRGSVISSTRVDCIVETPKYVYIFEFKLDGTADEALAQIEAKGYARPYAADSRTVHCIGVSFSSETGTVGEWKSLQLK